MPLFIDKNSKPHVVEDFAMGICDPGLQKEPQKYIGVKTELGVILMTLLEAETISCGLRAGIAKLKESELLDE